MGIIVLRRSPRRDILTEGLLGCQGILGALVFRPSPEMWISLEPAPDGDRVDVQDSGGAASITVRGAESPLEEL